MNEILYELLSKLTALPVIRAYENGIEPAKPFITYELKLEQTPEHLRYSPLDAQGNRTIHTHIDATLELQCFGSPSLALLRQLAMQAHTGAQRDEWERHGIVLVEVGRLTHLAYLDESQKYHDRAVLELAIRYRVEVADTLHIIDTVLVAHQLNHTLNGEQTIGVTDNGKN